ncbi:GntR family transcriptional regulator [Nonomuraea sp. NPDC003214]
MLDREGPVPIYRQIADVIAGRVNRGELLPGEPVPSEALMETEFRVSRSTARRVARELRERGVAYTIQGEGTFIGLPDTPRRSRKGPIYREIAADISRQITQGGIAPNRAIPGEKAMMRKYGVAKATARSAVSLLREQGWVFTVPQRGTFVSAQERWPAGGED